MAAVRGAFAARGSDGEVLIFAATAANLYKYVDMSSPWDDVSGVSVLALPDDDFWSMDQTGTFLFAVCGGTAPQIINVDSGTDFAAVAGSPPQARIVRAVQDFVMLGDLSTGRNRVRWSGLQDFNSSTAWTVGTKFCDEKIFPSDGFVSGITRVGGGLGGLIILTDALYRHQRVGSRAVFEFYQMEKNQGSKSPYSIIEHGQTAYYYGVDGFQAAGPAGFEGDVGVEYVDEYFAATANTARPRMVCGSIDPKRPRFNWLYPSTGNTGYYLDKLIGYDKVLKRWYHADVEASIIFPAAAPGTSMEQFDALGYDLDSIPYSLDSAIWKGGALRLGGFDTSDRLVFFSGPAREALLQTTQLEPIKGRRFYVNGFRPITDAPTVTGRVHVTERPMTTPVSGGLAAINAKGAVPIRASGRYLAAEVRIPEGETWTHAAGVDFMDDDLKADGER